MDIAIDFDGTCVTHDYPNVGLSIGAQEVLKKLVHNGHKLILFTMRSGKALKDAVDWFGINEILLYGVQSNPTQKKWTKSPKAYAQLYIDDAALGIPLKKDLSLSTREFVDWVKVEEWLVEKKILLYDTKQNTKS